MAHPCALTTSVSQISEKGALGSRLVTAIGRVIGTLELRRMVSGTFALCMVSLFQWCARFPVAGFWPSLAAQLADSKTPHSIR